ncbi:MAG: bacillithiol biosynthesis BshC, partial [Candidatus Eisenbacteria bacterium]|nr:bacillithiol biosynthesis BshC [Candidatus Eisenbacteria bacterium]
DDAGLRALAKAKRAPLDARLGEAMRAYHRRLGASPESLDSLERLVRGDAVVAVAGQQPAPLGGPLYALHKTACAVGLAAEIGARTGVPAVPMFWMHGEDSDFAEIRTATIADATLALHDLELPASAHREGGLIGAVPLAPLAELEAAALRHWAPFPGHADAARLLERASTHARDLGEAYSALLLALFADQGLVVIDPRLPEFRAAARPIIDRYLSDADRLQAAARAAGDRLEAMSGQRPLGGPALDSFVFRIEDGTRHKATPDEARALGARAELTPSVALRPVVQDGVFPTVAMACGAAEASYLAQLREVFEGLGVRPACPVPRLSVTWLPASGIELLEASGARIEELVFESDAVLRRLADHQVPADLRSALERGREASRGALERLADAARAVDSSLPQMIESARGKIDYQFERLREGVAGKVRHRLEQGHPEWPRLRYYVSPGDKLQERRIASLEPVARRGAGVVADLCRIAGDHARSLASGGFDHWVLEP